MANRHLVAPVHATSSKTRFPRVDGTDRSPEQTDLGRRIERTDAREMFFAGKSDATWPSTFRCDGSHPTNPYKTHFRGRIRLKAASLRPLLLSLLRFLIWATAFGQMIVTFQQGILGRDACLFFLPIDNFHPLRNPHEMSIGQPAIHIPIQKFPGH